MHSDKMLYIIRGVSGSGKTTLAQNLAKDGYEVAADYFFYDIEGEYQFNPNLLGKAHDWCQSHVRGCMSLGEEKTIAVHNTFTKESEMHPYIDMAKEYGYNVTVLVVENRHGNENHHGVPEHVLQRQENNLKNSIKLR